MTEARTQRLHYECGPVAIQNAQLLLGHSPAGTARLKKELKTVKKRGTHSKNICTWLEDNNYGYEEVSKRAGRGVYIALYYTGPKTRHFVTISNGKCHNYWNNHRYVANATKYSISPIWLIRVYTKT